MAQYMCGTPGRARDASSPHRLLNYDGDGTMICKSLERGKSAHKYSIGIRLRSALLKILHDGQANFLRQRQESLPPILTRDGDRCPFLVDIVDTQMPNIAGTKSQACQ